MKKIILFCLLGVCLIANAEEKVTEEKLMHFSVDGKHYYGKPEADGKGLRVLEGNIFDSPKTTNTVFALDKVQPLPAVLPSKMIAVGLNYRSHFSSSKGRAPRLFSKVPSSLTSDGQPIWFYPDTVSLHYEGELVVIIGKQAKNISVAEASDYIFGVTAGNDVTDRGWQGSDLQWIRAKGADSFAPLSSWILKGADYNDLLVETRLNGKVVQSESTKNLLFTVDEIVSYASQYFTLEPGDMIFTGTSGTTQSMSLGDVVEVSVAGAGSVVNTVRAVP